MGLRIKLILTLIVILVFNVCPSYAGWQGPSVIASGNWGKGVTNFGKERGDTGDTLPALVAILFDGKIVIADDVNERQIVYKSDGTLFKVVPWEISKDGGKIINPEYISYNYRNVQGYTKDNQIWTQFENYILKSATGVRIQKTKERPADLGIVQTKLLATSKYNITVIYPDKVWSTIAVDDTASYLRDANGNVYSIGQEQIIRFNNCGKELARLTLPADSYDEISNANPNIDPKIKLIEEYGEPLIAPYGDVYAWKRTPTKYSIVKWTWTDDPNQPTGPDAPAGLTVAASTTGLYLAWQAAPQDPGCVSGYEISRSTSSGGTFSVLTTTDKGVLNYNDTTAEAGTTYYYKLRAKAGSDFSPYTSTASGKR